MERRLTLYAEKIDGALKITNKAALEQWLKLLEEGEEIEIDLTPVNDSKTLRQLKLCYHCLREISDSTGYSVEEVKLIMKIKAGLCFHHEIDDKQITQCKSIGKMTKKELSKFVEFMDLWASQTLSIALLSYDDIKFLRDEK